MARIVVTETFRSVADLPAIAALDPRDWRFNEPDVTVDLRECQFIYPPAVLWCTVFCMLVRHRGVPCTLLVPANQGTADYLNTVGLFPLLQGVGVEVDARGTRPRSSLQTPVPLTVFGTVREAEDLANQALERLHCGNLASANLRPVVSEVFGELANNAVEHATSPIGSVGLVQFYSTDRGDRFVVAVADGGVGIRRTLEKNPELSNRVPYDWTAIELAVRERISGTGLPTRGIGLFGVAEDMRRPDRSLVIHSGIGMLEINEQVESRAIRTRLFPGTLASAAIPA